MTHASPRGHLVTNHIVNRRQAQLKGVEPCPRCVEDEETSREGYVCECIHCPSCDEYVRKEIHQEKMFDNGVCRICSCNRCGEELGRGELDDGIHDRCAILDEIECRVCGRNEETHGPDEISVEEVTDDKWNAIKAKIQLWFDNYTDWKKEHFELLCVPNLVVAGDKKPQKRTAFYSAIRTCFSDIPDTPFTVEKEDDEDEIEFEMVWGGLCNLCSAEDWNDPRDIEGYCEWCAMELAVKKRMDMDKIISVCNKCVHIFE
jgi:hypothetical protein